MYLLRNILLASCLLMAQANSYAQIITTFAGNGAASVNGDGFPATAAAIAYPEGGVFDKKGNYYFSNGYTSHVVRMIDTFGIIHTVVGNGSGGFSGDSGLATNAQLSNIGAVAVDSFGNIFIPDIQNYRIRRVDALSHIITTIAGNGISGFLGDNVQATSAIISIVPSVCVDPFGNLYFIDSFVRVRKVNTLGIISTYAGDGIGANTGDSAAATNASIATSSGICSDILGNIYIGCKGSIRKIDRNTGIITHFAGNGNVPYNGDEINADVAQFSPMMLCVDSINNLYISDYMNHRIRVIDNAHIIHTIVGNGIAGFYGDNGPAKDAQIYDPYGITTDKCGNVYIADSQNKRIRKVAINPNCWTLGVENVPDKTEKIIIYPNPADDKLTITLGNSISHITITNMIGKVVYNKTCNGVQAEIDIRHWVNGIYFVQADGLFAGKFVKE